MPKCNFMRSMSGNSSTLIRIMGLLLLSCIHPSLGIPQLKYKLHAPFYTLVLKIGMKILNKTYSKAKL